MTQPSPTLSNATPDLVSTHPAWWSIFFRTAWPIVVSLIIAVTLHYFVRPRVGGYVVNLMVVSAINIVLAVSLTIVNGFTGQFSIGHAAFAGIGSYVGGAVIYYGSYYAFGDVDFHGGFLSYSGREGSFVGNVFASGDLLFLASLIAGGIVAAIAGYIVGLPSLRLRGDYLAIVTLGFGEIARVLLQNSLDQIEPYDMEGVSKWTLPLHVGKSLGFNNIAVYTTVFWSWLAVGIFMFAVVRLKRSAYGRALLSVREDEIAASSMGVHLAKYKVRAFVFAAFLAGVAGAMYVAQVGQITPTELGFQRSFDVIIMVVLGGLGSVSGAALAAILVTLLPEILRDPPTAWPTGFIVLGVILGIALAIKQGRNWRGCATLAGILIIYEIIRRTALHFGIVLSNYRMIIYALSLILVMILRPQGLLGLREIWEFLTPRALLGRKES